MPLIDIEIREGSSREVVRDLHDRVAGLIPEVLDARSETVRTRVTEISVQGWDEQRPPVSATRMLPLVRIEIMEGRSLAVRHQLHDRVAGLVAEILGVPLETVRTYITEMSIEGWGIGGVPASIARREVIEARRRANEAAAH